MWARLAGAVLAAAGGLGSSLWRVARQLFHEVTGALFAVFAVVGGAAIWREWRRGSAEWLIALAVVFTLAMAAFAVASFRSARRVR